MIAIEDYASAIHYASRSIELNSHQWEPNRSLAIAHAMQGEYGPAIAAGRRAEDLRASLITDPELMYAVARSYAAIGNVPVAEKTMGILAHNNPSVRGTPDWNACIAFLAARLKASTLNK